MSISLHSIIRMVRLGWIFLVAIVINSGTAVRIQAQLEQVPSALVPVDSSPNSEKQQTYLRFMSGKSAATYGFSSIAERIFKSLLESESDLSESIKEDVRYQLILSLLNQGKIKDAKEYLKGFSNTNADTYKFVTLLIAYIENASTEDLQSRLASLAGSNIGTDQVWITVIKGIVMTRQGQRKEARAVLDGALEQSANAFQRSWIESLIWREEILNGEASESLAFSLKSQIDNAVNPLIASQLTQQYAIVLNALGNEGEAIHAIERQLPLLGNEYREQKDRLFMLLAILSGRQSGKTKVAIEEILLRGSSPRIRSMAFYYWLSSVDFSNVEETRILSVLLDQNPNDPLRNEITYALALNSFYQGNLTQSQARIDSILESDAEDSLKQSALRVLIAVCWSQNPPQYRLAAEHLLRLRRLTENPQEQERFTQLIADSYYLNGDYENAIPYYRGLLGENTGSSDENELLFKLTDSFLKMGNIDAARPILDRFHQEHPELSELIWGSEWNFNLHLVRSGRLEESIVRMERLHDQLMKMPEVLWCHLARMRVAWLLSFLNFQRQDYPQSLVIIEETLASYESFPTGEQTQMTAIRDELLLLSARNYFAQDNESEALIRINLIRTRHDSDAAAASYILEARYYLSKSQNSNAQRALLQLADQYPESEYAPVALYEAAINVENRTTETSDQEAIALYERISSQFPKHPLNFISKLRQGDLLRKSNQFALAIAFFENMRSEFRGDPRTYLVDIALGESYLAMGSTRLDYVDQAVQILERVFDLSNLPVEVRIEAGTKAAIGLDKVGRNYRSQDLLWRVITLVNREPASGVKIGASGKYWLARATLMLSDQLIANGARNEVERLVEMADAMQLPGVNLIRNKL